MTDADKKILNEIINRVHNLNGEQKNEILDILKSWQTGPQRGYQRLEAKTGVDVVVGDSLIKTTTRDLSASGIYINTSGKFTANKDVRIVFSVPGYDKPFKLQGMIVRVEQNGMAVRFENITPYFKQILDDVIWENKDQNADAD